MSILGQILANTAQPQVQKQEKTSSANNAAATRKAATPPAPAQTGTDGNSPVRGEVIDLRLNRVLVQLENGAQISARLEGSVPLYIGQKADFFVSQTTDSQITLKLAPGSSVENSLVDKILQSANLQKNSHTEEIVNELLAHQQPVTGDNIRHYLMLSAKYPHLPVRDLILMEMYKIPVTEENVSQFAEYRADSHRLLVQGTTLFQTLINQISSLDTLEQAAFIEKLQQILHLGEGNETAPSSAEGFGVLPDGIAETAADTADANLSGAATNQSGTVAAGQPDVGSLLADANLTGEKSTAASASKTAESISQEQTESFGSTAVGNSSQTGLPKNSEHTPESTLHVQQGNSSSSRDNVENNHLKHENLKDKPTTDAADTVNGNGDVFHENAVPEDAALTSAEASKVLSEARQQHLSLSERLLNLKQEFLDSFLLSPKEIAEDGRITDYYEQLNERLAALEQFVETLSKSTGSEAAQTSAKQLRSNLSFMDMVNQAFPYVQLPLQFKEHPAHGELYVYERKRSLSDSGSLSALLHLELEALGTTDIFVTLTGTSVATRFYLADEIAQSLVTTELPHLQKALEKQGYAFQAEVTLREDSPGDASLLEQFLEEQTPSGGSRYTFDIRA